MRGGESGPGRGLECPRMISGVVGPYLGVGSRAGGQRREPMVATGRRKTWRAAKFWASGCPWKTRGDRIFSVGGADLWFAPGCGNRTSTRRPVLRFRSACGGLRRLDKLRGLGWAAAKDLRWGFPNCDPGLLSPRALGPSPPCRVILMTWGGRGPRNFPRAPHTWPAENLGVWKLHTSPRACSNSRARLVLPVRILPPSPNPASRRPTDGFAGRRHVTFGV